MKASRRPLGEVAGKEMAGNGAPRRRNPQTVAWIVLWIAFGTFWALVLSASVGVKHYYDTATLAGAAILNREDGIVLFRDAVSSSLINAQDNMWLREGDDLIVGQGARASLSLFDGSSVQLYSGSELRLSQLRKSRFHDSLSTVAIALNKGTARFNLGDATTADREFVVKTPHGSAILGPGDFGLDVQDSRTRVSSRQGEAVLTRAGQSVSITRDQKGMLSEQGMSAPLPEGDELVMNGDFSQGFANWEMLQVDESGRPGEPGRRVLTTERIDGREVVAMHVTRVSPKATHNETGLSQIINKDLSDYKSLRLQANIRVDDQSLSGGGYMGYEYPVMIRVKYRDATGGQIDWSHGFFYRNPEERPTPNGEEVPQGKWFYYSGDLMQVNPPPVHIVSLEVLSAGHSFSGMIANVSLIAK